MQCPWKPLEGREKDHQRADDGNRRKEDPHAGYGYRQQFRIGIEQKKQIIPSLQQFLVFN
jgi:hypothetical protein